MVTHIYLGISSFVLGTIQNPTFGVIYMIKILHVHQQFSIFFPIAQLPCVSQGRKFKGVWRFDNPKKKEPDFAGKRDSIWQGR